MKMSSVDFSYLWTYFQGAEDELKHAVGIVRPVSVAFQVVRGFHFYEDGVFTSDTCGSTSQVSFFFFFFGSLSLAGIRF